MVIEPSQAIAATAVMLVATLLNCVVCVFLRQQKRAKAFNVLLVLGTITFACSYWTLSLPAVKKATTPFVEMPSVFEADKLERTLKWGTIVSYIVREYSFLRPLTYSPQSYFHSGQKSLLALLREDPGNEDVLLRSCLVGVAADDDVCERFTRLAPSGIDTGDSKILRRVFCRNGTISNL